MIRTVANVGVQGFVNSHILKYQGLLPTVLGVRRWIQDLLPVELKEARTSRNPKKNASMASVAQAKPMTKERRELLLDALPTCASTAEKSREVATQVLCALGLAGLDTVSGVLYRMGGNEGILYWFECYQQELEPGMKILQTRLHPALSFLTTTIQRTLV